MRAILCPYPSPSLSPIASCLLGSVAASSADKFWAPDAVSHPQVQKRISTALDSAMAESILSSSDRTSRSRFLSLRGPYAGLWLLTPPSEPLLELHDAHFKVAVRLRLGLPPADPLPLACICGFEPLSSDPHHFLSCKELKPAATARHDLLVQALRQVTAGVTIHSEREEILGDGSRLDGVFHLSQHVGIDVSR